MHIDAYERPTPEKGKSTVECEDGGDVGEGGGGNYPGNSRA